MIKKIKNAFLAIAAALALGAPALVPAVAYAADPITEPLTCSVEFEFDKKKCTPPDSSGSLQGFITQVINIFSVIVGVVAVIMIIYGGFRYITSGGDSGKVSEAKNTIIYAIIGLIIVALSQFIARFVLQQTTSIT